MTNKVQILFKKSDPEAILPTKEKNEDAGYDVYALENTLIKEGETKIVPTGFMVAIPEEYYLNMKPRSGNTVKTPLRIEEGVIDSGYRNNVGVIAQYYDRKDKKDTEYIAIYKGEKLVYIEAIENDTPEHKIKALRRIDELRAKEEYKECEVEKTKGYLIKKGDRIAQMILCHNIPSETKEVDELPESLRGTKGFGSSGK